MTVITAVPIEDALRWPTLKEPSPRVLRNRQLEREAGEVVAAVNQKGAALINVEGDDLPTDRYLTGLRSALRRLGHTKVLLQKRRGQDQIAAWMERPEDEARLQTRRATGARLGQMAKARAKKARGRPRRKVS